MVGKWRKLNLILQVYHKWYGLSFSEKKTTPSICAVKISNVTYIMHDNDEMTIQRQIHQPFHKVESGTYVSEQQIGSFKGEILSPLKT